MFEFPDAKRVRREDLDERSSVTSFDEDEEAQQKLRDALSRKLAGSLSWEIITKEQPPPNLEPQVRRVDGPVDALAHNDDEDDETGDEEPPEEFEFKLFGTTQPATKVVLEKIKPFKPGQGSIVARRPASYYFAPPATPGQRAQYEAALVTWDQLMERSRRRFWGLERPWRTIAKIDNTTSKARKPAKQGQTGGSKIVAEGATVDDGGKKKNGRPGKKTRIAMRKRERVAKSKKEAEEKARAEKEEHLKAKKKRLNHTKKLRLRAKAKEKKMVARAEAGEQPAESTGAGGGPGSPSLTTVADSAMKDV